MGKRRGSAGKIRGEQGAIARPGTPIETGNDQRLLHPISQMTTFELRNLRRALEATLAMQTLPRYVRSREELQEDLSEVIAEQDERARIRRANTDA
jgi:hypothetical protein